MNTKKLELIGLVSLFALGIVAVDLEMMGRTRSFNDEGTYVLTTPSLISSAQASPLEHSAMTKTADESTTSEKAPIYLDLGAKF